MSKKKTLALFEGVGIELEYMIVNRETLDVLPIADELLKTVVCCRSFVRRWPRSEGQRTR